MSNPTNSSLSSTLTILLPLYQESNFGSEIFFAFNIDGTAAISFDSTGKGEVIALVQSGEFMRFKFTQKALPFIVDQYSQKGVRWQIRQHLLPAGLVNDHHLQRFFTFGFEGLAIDAIAFAPGITTSEEAICIMTQMPTIKTVATPTGMIDNPFLIEYLKQGKINDVIQKKPNHPDLSVADIKQMKKLLG